jgi:hypothetical protein
VYLVGGGKPKKIVWGLRRICILEEGYILKAFMRDTHRVEWDRAAIELVR